MSTHALIGIARSDGGVTGIYCHFDGYIDGVGKILVEHYNIEEKVLELMELGNLVSLRANIGVKHDPRDWQFFKDNDQCCSFKRDEEDRNEDATQYGVGEESFFFANRGVHFKYLFMDGQWWIRGLRDKSNRSVKEILDFWDANVPIEDRLIRRELPYEQS